MAPRPAIVKERRIARNSSTPNGRNIRASLRNASIANANGNLTTLQSTVNLRNGSDVREHNGRPSSSAVQPGNRYEMSTLESISTAERSGTLIESGIPGDSTGDASNSVAANTVSPVSAGNADDHMVTTDLQQGTQSGLSSEDVPEPPVTAAPLRSRLSRRRNSRNAQVQNVGLNERSNNRLQFNVQNNTSNMADDELQVAHNRVKLELVEALRDKKAYSSAMIALREQKENLEKDVRILKQKNVALESTLTISKRSKSGKMPVWSMDNLRETNIANYQGICLSAGEIAKKEAMLLTTETYMDERDHGKRKRNWKGSATRVSYDEAQKAVVYVMLPDGSYAIPTSCMYRAKNHDHYVSPYPNDKEFARHCIQMTLNSPVGSMMNDDEKRECMNLILCHRQTVKKFKSIVADSIGNRKKITFGMFLRSLGYSNGAKANSDKLTSSQKAARNLEREIAYDKCVQIGNDGNIDTMYWRVSRWSELCLDTAANSTQAREMDEAEKKLEVEGILDNLFMNEAARRAYTELRGHQVSEGNDSSRSDVSILSLARADAAITTMLKWINIGGRGGVRNSNFNDCFRSLLPKSMDAIIEDVWEDLKCIVPHELAPSFTGVQRTEDDPFGNAFREWTCVFQSKEDNYLYLLAKPVYFAEKVCSWFGRVTDCYIGICSPNESSFKRIDAATSIVDIEESDIEQESNEIERNQQANQNNGHSNDSGRSNDSGCGNDSGCSNESNPSSTEES